MSALVSLGQAQAEEGQAEDAVKTFLEVLGLQENEAPDEVAEAHFQVCNTRKERLYSVLGDLTSCSLLRPADGENFVILKNNYVHEVYQNRRPLFHRENVAK